MAQDRAEGLYIRTLGALSIARDGEVVEGFASRKAQALLVYLACNPRTHPREVLAELLWDDRTQRQAMANLRVVLSSLRKEVGDYVDITRTTASIGDKARIDLDVADLQAAAAAFREIDGELTPSKVAAVAAALDLYEGDFLEGFFIPEAGGFEAWATAERERLHRLATEVLQGLGRWTIERGDYAEALAASRRLVKLDPLVEAGHRQLMEALARDGQRSQALAAYEELAETLQRELGLEPTRETLELVEAIHSDSLEVSSATLALMPRRQRLPVPAAPLIGREKEMGELKEMLLEGKARLLTLVGPGGMGKTRLALEVAHHLAGDFGDGAAFVSLTPLSDADAVAPAVAQALTLDFYRDQSRDPEKQLVDYLMGKELLLVLDNFEQVLDATSLLGEIVRSAPAVKLLVTSRERLKLNVEHVYVLEGLTLRQWTTVAGAREDASVRLFLHHARRVRPSFTLRPDHLQPLRQIMDSVGGMPLAIILAAGWVEALSPAQIAQEIERSLDLLQTVERDMPQRHRSMQAVFDMTFERLSERERACFAGLSVFRGGFTLEAARDVVEATPRELLKLVDHSLVSRLENGRFDLHELLRQFAAEQLAGSPQRQSAVRRQHAQYYCTFLQLREGTLKGPRSPNAEAEIAAELENISSAWRWAAEHEVDLVLRSQSALGVFFTRRGLMREGIAAFLPADAALIKQDGYSAKRMTAFLAWAGHFVQHRSLPEAEELLVRARACLHEAIARGQDVRAERALLLMVQSEISRNEGEARVGLEKSLSLYSELGRRWEMGSLHYELGWSHYFQSNYRLSLKHFQEAARLCEGVGDLALALRIKADLGMVMARMGKVAKAEDGLRAALALSESRADIWSTTLILLRLGEVLFLSGRFEEALETMAKCRANWMRTGYQLGARFAANYERLAELHMGRYVEGSQQYQSVIGRQEEAHGSDDAEGLARFVEGCAALALGGIHEARAHLEAGVAANLAVPHIDVDEATWCQAALCYVACQQGDIPAARKQLVAVLQTAWEQHLLWAAIHALPAAALLKLQEGEKSRAVELYALAMKQAFVANSRWFEDVAGRHITAAAKTLPAEEAAAARAHGQARDLWQTVEELLQELAEA